MDAHNQTHVDSKNSTVCALGEWYVKGNCHMASSLLGILECHVKGSQADGNPNVDALCKEKNNNLDEIQNTLLTNCNCIGKEQYCNDTGAALNAALDKWQSVRKAKNSTSGGSGTETGDCEAKIIRKGVSGRARNT
ncbi:hypothetical protein, unlikely [Trypanosoma congolense IL3000]|uniref:Uncharacterized protein n=1 Tax=Trypanosoma congolense (strain IL3000) TaxID=1068625 RepID=F9WFT6_TRYCI|nr:hypothetical protein, unlikely [Trypanosoma congolense IL3000]